MQVGTKELKNRLSYYLRLIRAGETVQVTDRGTVIAQLCPVAAPATEDAALKSLARQGLVTLATGKLPDLAPARRMRRQLVSDMIVADRR